jgi:condensation domain-containing protein
MTGQDRFLVGVFVAGRNRAEEEPLIGRFAGMIPMPVDLTGPDPVAAAAKSWWEAYDFHDVVVPEVARKIEGLPPPGRRPLTDVRFMLNSGEPEFAGTGELRLRRREREPTTVSPSDLTLFTGPASDGRFELRLEYRTDLYTEDTAKYFLRCYRAVLAQLNT